MPQNSNNVLTKLIGDYQTFFSDLLHRMNAVGIDISGMPMSHLLYRVETIEEYIHIRDNIKPLCRKFAETQFNGRAVSVIELRDTLFLEDGFQCSVIELPAPRAVHMYPSGLESIGVVLGKKLQEFKTQYSKQLTGIKDHGEHCQPAFITFENEKTAKFYDISLKEIIKLQGYTMETFAHKPN